MKTLAIVTLSLIALSIGSAHAAGATYQKTSNHTFGSSHNNYHSSGKSYGASANNYNGKEKYSSAPSYTTHPSDYASSRQATDTSAPY